MGICIKEHGGISGWKSTRGNLKASRVFAKLTRWHVRSGEVHGVGPSGREGSEKSDESFVKERIVVNI